MLVCRVKNDIATTETDSFSFVFFFNILRVFTGLHRDKERKEALCGIQEFLQLRSNKKAFSQLCDHILPCVVGRKKWEKKMDISRVSRIASFTDEAWALLVLENSWGTWKQQADSPTGKVTSDVRIATKWTNTSSLATRSEGWGDRGIERFNQLCTMVAKDRVSNKDVEMKYLENKQEASDRMASKRKRKRGEVAEAKADVICSFLDLDSEEDTGGSI